MTKPSASMGLIVGIVDRARRSVPWPERITLPDGTIQCSGLTDAQINDYIAGYIIQEMAKMPLPDALVQGAARAIFDAESEVMGTRTNESEFTASVSTYRSAAMTGFRAILRQFLLG